jgi:hypothetical protein
MSLNTRLLRKAADNTLDALEMLSYSEGFEAATIGLEELSDIEANGGDLDRSEILRWAARELRGDNA